MAQIRFVDTTIRDGQQSLWANNMRTGMILPVAEKMDQAGFEAIELTLVHPKKIVRELKEDPWERIRQVRKRVAKVMAANADPVATVLKVKALAHEVGGFAQLKLLVEALGE